MNTTLTGLGIALVLALAAALLAPWFIDWNAWRPAFEARAAAALGVPVRIGGPIAVTLLPTPHLTLSDVRAGRSGNQRLAVKTLSFDLAITPLLSGRFEVTNLAIDGPTVVATVDGNGRALLPVDPTAVAGPRLGAIALNDVTIRDGTVELVDALTGERRRVTQLAASGAATSLAGPMKLAGSAAFDGTRYGFRLGAGTFQNGRGNVQLAVTPAGGATLDLDGTLATDRGQPLFTGRGTLRPPPDPHGRPGAEPPWQFTGRVTATPRRLVADQLDLQFGAAARALHLNGSAELDLGPQRGIALVLQARQLDLDRARGVSADAPAVPPLATLRALSGGVGLPPRPAWPLTATISVGSLVLGGDLLQDATASVTADANGWTIQRLSVALPGRTDLSVGGRIVAARGGPSFAGDATLHTSALPDFLRWLSAKAESNAVVAPVRELSLAGRVTAAPERFALDDLDVEAGGARLRGTAAWRGGAPRPQIDVAFDADRLDVDRLGLPELAVALGGERTDPFAGDDFDLRLAAKRLDWGGVEAGGVDLDLGRRGGALSIRRFKLADLGGAALDLHGALSLADDGPKGDLSARLDAGSLDGVVAALRAAPLPSALADAVAARAAALVPAHLALSLASPPSAHALDLHLAGTLGHTDVVLDSRVQRLGFDAPLTAKISAASPDGASLLAQLGIATSPVGDAGRGDVHARLSGTPSRGADLEAGASLAGTTLTFAGKLQAVRAAAATAHGRLTATGDDLAPLLVLLGRAPPAALPALPINVQADARFDGHGVALDGIAGAVAGRSLDGHLAWEDGALAGSLTLPHLAVSDLLGLALGPLAVEEATAPAQWPDGPLAPSLFAGLSGRVALRSGQLDLLPGTALDSARLTLALAPSETRLEGVAGTLAGGDFAGDLRLRRVGDQAALALTAKLDGADLGELMWRADGHPVATGRLSLGADVQGTGKSLAGIAADLAGSGSLKASEVKIAALDPGAFGRVATALRGTDTIEPTRVQALTAAELPKGDFAAQTITSAFTVVSGVLRADIAAQSSAADASGHAGLDLGRLALTGDLALAPKAAPAGGDAAPQVVLRFAGPLDAPVRTLDVAPFTGYLTMRSIERQVKEVDALEAERRRQEAEQAAAAKAEADRRAAEEEARKAEAARQAAQAEAARKAEAEKKAAADQVARDAAAAKFAADRAEAERRAAAERAAEAARRDAAARPLTVAPATIAPLPPLGPPREVGPVPGASRVTIGPPRDVRPRVVSPPALGDATPRIIVIPQAPPGRGADDPIGLLLESDGP